MTIIKNVNELPSGNLLSAPMTKEAAENFKTSGKKFYIKWHQGGMLFIKD